MSTYYSNHAVASACPDVITLPLMEVSNNARAGIARRKVDAMDDGLVKHAGDELARSIKRCRRSCEDIERIRQPLANLSLNAPAKKRIRPQGQAVKLRKRFLKSLRNLSAVSGSTESAGFAYTFTFVRQTISTSESAMSLFTEDTEVAMEDIDQQVVVVVPQQEQVPMSIDEPQEVDPEVLREASASISIVDMEMEEAWEHVPAPSSAAMPIDDVLDDVPMVPAHKKDLVSRFFARMASTKAIRGAVLPRQMVIEADESVKAEPVTPRPKSLTGRAQGKVNQRSIHDEEESSPLTAVRTFDVVADTAALEQQDSASTAGDVDAHDVLAETEEESPVGVEEDCSALSAEAQAGSACEVSPATVKESESYWEDLFGPEASDETEEESPEEAEEADNSVAQAETAQHEEDPRADVEIIEDVAEDLHCRAASPGTVQVDDDEDVFGPVTFHPSQLTESDTEPEVECTKVLYEPSVEDEWMASSNSGMNEAMDDEEEDMYFSLPPSPVLRPNATSDGHLRDLEMDSLELPSLCGMETDMFTDSSDSDDDSVMGSPVHTAMWVLRETRVLPDLEEDDVAVVVPGDEVEESGIIATADSRFGSLVCLIDRWSCADDPPPPPDPVLAESMSCDSDIWYDAMDTDNSISPAPSLGNIQMACDGPSFAISEELLASTTPSPSSGMPGTFGIACPLGNPQLLDDIFCNVATTPLTTIDYSSFVSCSFRLSEDDLSLAMLQDVSSLDLIDLSVSRVPTPVPSPALPGAWWESLESVDDLLL